MKADEARKLTDEANGQATEEGLLVLDAWKEAIAAAAGAGASSVHQKLVRNCLEKTDAKGRMDRRFFRDARALNWVLTQLAAQGFKVTREVVNGESVTEVSW